MTAFLAIVAYACALMLTLAAVCTNGSVRWASIVAAVACALCASAMIHG